LESYNRDYKNFSYEKLLVYNPNNTIGVEGNDIEFDNERNIFF